MVIAVVAFGSVGYYALTAKPSASSLPSGYDAEQVYVQIAGATYNTTAGYFPANFSVTLGQHIEMIVQNTDNKTHGLAIPSFSLDTGQIPPNGTATLTFNANALGNFTYYEPKADCGGGNCDAGQSLNGYFLVVQT